jgi:hypothetical protein
MIINLLYFVAFVAMAYLTTCLSASRPSGEPARIPVRSDQADDQHSH